MALSDTANGLSVNVIPNEGPAPRAQVQISKIADGTDTAIVSVYLPVDWAVINSTASKAWMAAEDISTAAPNAVYTSN